jgi:hypothetical protein
MRCYAVSDGDDPHGGADRAGRSTAFTVWQPLQAQNVGLSEWRPQMFRVAGGVADAQQSAETPQPELPKQDALTQAKHSAAEKPAPRPLPVEDNMATCG